MGAPGPLIYEPSEPTRSARTNGVRFRDARYVGISAIPRGKVRRASGPVERCPLWGKSPESPHIVPKRAVQHLTNSGGRHAKSKYAAHDGCC